MYYFQCFCSTLCVVKCAQKIGFQNINIIESFFTTTQGFSMMIFNLILQFHKQELGQVFTEDSAEYFEDSV